MSDPAVPPLRIRELNQASLNESGDYVLYWMIANRRVRWNFSLQRAVEWAVRLNKPLVILEALRINYRWASDRLHRFVMQGMADNHRACSELPATYYCYVEPEHQHGSGLLEKLAEKSCVVVTDDFPCFFVPAMLRIVSRMSPVLMEGIDSNGLLPLRATDHLFPTAYAFRRFLQKELPKHFEQMPVKNPFANVDLPRLPSLPEEILARWPMASDELLKAGPAELAGMKIDHGVGPAAFDGGTTAAGKTLTRFLNRNLDRYAEERNSPDDSAASGLSPYLHFGHISTHEIFAKIARREEWTPAEVSSKASGSREGWWGMSPASESFLDELITWRELGYNMCSLRNDYDRYESLPDWARKTLEEHADDPREVTYTLEEFEESRTDDELWNAAQRQLVREGRMHNYLRMLWGKKILEWTESPRQALKFMIELNNKYAVDGRNPNSYSGIFWVLGRYDRAWGPERPIFGKIRYMTSDSTRRKLKLTQYLRTYAE
ncbi:deoxyribodipyrimidine photolyase [Planctomicrobium sp. SH661]|uniref:deoxyribodipyrimidine photolyase n=1 Tax=Planctomicrobium sp. SH661 TaxID=3448124 RepID=UPI003F5BA0F7